MWNDFLSVFVIIHAAQLELYRVGVNDDGVSGKMDYGTAFVPLCFDVARKMNDCLPKSRLPIRTMRDKTISYRLRMHGRRRCVTRK